MAALKKNMQTLMSAPRSVDVEITSRCNLRCRYCYFAESPVANNSDLPTDQWKHFFKELGDAAVMNVCLSGGEPFLREDLPSLVESIAANRMRFSILSNGSCIDNAIAKLLAKTGRCNYVQISVDGSTPSTHDVCRGPGAFERAVQGIRVLQRVGLRVEVRFTLHRYNLCDLENTASFLLDELGLDQFSTNSVDYIGACKQGGTDLRLKPGERVLAMKNFHHLTERYPGRIIAQAGPLADDTIWRKMESARTTNALPFIEGGRLTGCNCTRSRLTVRPDGVYIPCTMLSHISLGKINENTLLSVWHNSEPLNRLRTRNNISLDEFTFCRECEYIPYCTGNCPGMAYALVGEVNHPNPDDCLRNFLDDGGILS